MTQRQRRFIDEYLVDLNGTQAAIRAGYSPKSAAVTAAKNLRNPVSLWADYALLGSIGLFLLLAAVMFLTRNVDWHDSLRVKRPTE